MKRIAAERAMQGMAMRATMLDLAWEWFHRVVAAYCLACGIIYWIRLIGYYDDPLWRFDLMPVHWQVACVVLATLFPFAASGLWMIASWGVVIWFLCAVTETLMYGVFPELFLWRPEIVGVHGVIALVYCGLRIALYLRRRRQQD